MFKRKYIYINMLLILCIFFLVTIFKQSVQDEDLAIQQSASKIVLEEKTKAKGNLGKDINDWSPLVNIEKNSIEKYSTVSNKNLFRPDRKEWEPPPPPPPPPKPPKEEEEKEEEEEKPVEPDLPEPFLYGIVIAGKYKRMAIMRGHTQPDVKPVFKTIRISGVARQIQLPMRKGQAVLDKKSSLYEVGDYISGAKIVSIEKDLVTLARDNGTSIEVKLFDKDIKKPSSPVPAKKRPIPQRRPPNIRNWSSRGRRPLTRNQRGYNPNSIKERMGKRGSGGSISGH